MSVAVQLSQYPSLPSTCTNYLYIIVTLKYMYVIRHRAPQGGEPTPARAEVRAEATSPGPASSREGAEEGLG